MEITRRDFLRYAGASASALGLSQLHLDKLERVLAQTAVAAPIVWLSGSGCTGCSISLLNAVNPTIDQVLTGTISLKFHPNVMAAAGDLAISAARSTQQAGGYILVVEGAIPTGNSSKYCYVWDEGGRSVTMAEAVRSLAAQARTIVAVGTCAAYGGIPRAYSPAAAKGVGAFLGRSVINMPGCPAHPDWIIGALVQVLGGTLPALDANGRPTAFYTKTPLHERCPRKETEEASRFGQDGRCMEELGCKGPSTHADCDLRWWNNKQNWCIGVNGLCIGCTEPDFPAFPLHKSGEDNDDDEIPVTSPLPYKVWLPFMSNGGH